MTRNKFPKVNNLNLSKTVKRTDAFIHNLEKQFEQNPFQTIELKSNDLNSNGDRREVVRSRPKSHISNKNRFKGSGNYDHLDIDDIRIGVEPNESFHSSQIHKAL